MAQAYERTRIASMTGLDGDMSVDGTAHIPHSVMKAWPTGV
jgi:hypothetical protein